MRASHCLSLSLSPPQHPRYFFVDALRILFLTVWILLIVSPCVQPRSPLPRISRELVIEDVVSFIPPALPLSSVGKSEVQETKTSS